VVPSTALKLVQISIISAVIFNEGDHDGAADSAPNEINVARSECSRNRVRHDDRSVELVRRGDRAKNSDLIQSFQRTESDDTSNASTTQGQFHKALRLGGGNLHCRDHILDQSWNTVSPARNWNTGFRGHPFRFDVDSRGRLVRSR
jgi:hypothetical protein